MGEFEDFIKAKYPVDYESLKEKYPNVPIVEFYGDEQDVWNHQQSKIEQLEKEKQALHNAFVYMDECRKEWHKAYMSLREEKALRGECE